MQHARLPCPSPTLGACSNSSIKSVMPSNHLILCRPLLLPPSIFPRIRVFSSELILRIRWPEYWSFSFSISSFNEYSGLISFGFLIHLISLQSEGLSRVFSNTTVQKHQFFRRSAFFTVQLSQPYIYILYQIGSISPFQI